MIQQLIPVVPNSPLRAEKNIGTISKSFRFSKIFLVLFFKNSQLNKLIKNIRKTNFQKNIFRDLISFKSISLSALITKIIEKWLRAPRAQNSAKRNGKSHCSWTIDRSIVIRSIDPCWVTIDRSIAYDRSIHRLLTIDRSIVKRSIDPSSDHRSIHRLRSIDRRSSSPVVRVFSRDGFSFQYFKRSYLTHFTTKIRVLYTVRIVSERRT